MSQSEPLHISTRLLHPSAGGTHRVSAEWQHRPSATPVYQTATFDQESPLEFGAFDYSRSGNPTRDGVERVLAELEGSRAALAFNSGMSAIAAVFGLLKPGDEIVASTDIYGGAYRLLNRIAERRGIVVRFAALDDLRAFAAAVTDKTRIIYAESIGNPLMTVADIGGLSRIARAVGARLVIDNTFLTPLNLRPLELGADIVVHSATKYLSGHGDATSGVLGVNDPTLIAELNFIRNAEGTALPPQECFLLERGLKTLDVRLERQQTTAAKVAALLAECEAAGEIQRVRYPGLRSLPGHDIHRCQSAGDGAVICFETGSLERSLLLVKSLALFPIRVSFGSVESSVSMPFSMSHASVPKELRSVNAVPQDLVRLSIGLEAANDLIADLSQAIRSVSVRRVPIAEIRASSASVCC